MRRKSANSKVNTTNASSRPTRTGCRRSNAKSAASSRRTRRSTLPSHVSSPVSSPSFTFPSFRCVSHPRASRTVRAALGQLPAYYRQCGGEARFRGRQRGDVSTRCPANASHPANAASRPANASRDAHTHALQTRYVPHGRHASRPPTANLPHRSTFPRRSRRGRRHHVERPPRGRGAKAARADPSLAPRFPLHAPRRSGAPPRAVNATVVAE